jgi:hypothetical protein
MKSEIDIVEEVLDGEVCEPSGDFRWDYRNHPEDHYGNPQRKRVLSIEIDDTWFNRASKSELKRAWAWIREMQQLGRV